MADSTVPSDQPEEVRPAQKTTPADQNNSLAPSDSPCVAVCSTLYDDICRGCGRTAAEVANWVFLSEDEKKDIRVRITEQGYPRRKG